MQTPVSKKRKSGPRLKITADVLARSRLKRRQVRQSAANPETDDVEPEFNSMGLPRQPMLSDSRFYKDELGRWRRRKESHGDASQRYGALLRRGNTAGSITTGSSVDIFVRGSR